MSRLFLAAVCGLLSTLPVFGQGPERIDSEKVQIASKALIEATDKLTDLPHKLALDAKQAMGLKAEKAGLILIPDSKLTVETLKKIDKDIVPVGVLYLYKVTPLVVEEGVAADQHRTVDVTLGDKTATVSVMPLAAGKIAGRLVLLAYAKGKSPIVVTDLAESEEKTELPLDLSARRAGDKRAALVVNVLSKYRASILVTGQE